MQPRTPIDEAAVFIPAKRDLGALAGPYLTRAQVSVQGTNPTAYPNSNPEHCISGVSGP